MFKIDNNYSTIPNKSFYSTSCRYKFWKLSKNCKLLKQAEIENVEYSLVTRKTVELIKVF